MAKEPFDRSAPVPAPSDIDLGVKLILFGTMPEDAPLAPLAGKLLLTSEDEKGSDYVFGYIINNSMPLRLRSFMKQAGVTNVSEAEQFKPIFDGAVHGFEPLYEEQIITILTRDGLRLGTTNEAIFGPFTAYSCETLEDVATMLPLLQGHETIVLTGLFMIDRQDLIDTVKDGTARLRAADADIVFHRSPMKRTELAFPPRP